MLAQETIPVSSSTGKKITIHVANNNNRGSSAGSPAPPTAGSFSSDGAPNGTAPPPGPRNPFSANPARGLAAGQAQFVVEPPGRRSLSTAGAASPAPSIVMKHEDLARRSPAVLLRATAPNNPSPMLPAPMANGHGPYPAAAAAGPLPNGNYAPPPPQPVLPYEYRHRFPGRGEHPYQNPTYDFSPETNSLPPLGLADALITKLMIRTHPAVATDSRFKFSLSPDAREAQTSFTVNVPAAHWKQQVAVRLHPALAAAVQQQEGHQQQQQTQAQRPYKLYVIVNGATLAPSAPAPAHDPLPDDMAGARLFETPLHVGVNTVQVQVIAAMPKGEKLPNGSEVEFEKMTVLANMLKF